MSADPPPREHRHGGTAPWHLQFLLYHSVLILPQCGTAAACEAIVKATGWGGPWRDGIYRTAHYHSGAHEALLIYSGSAHVRLGGPRGIVADLSAGDAAVLPAGTAHQNLGCSTLLRALLSPAIAVRRLVIDGGDGAGSAPGETRPSGHECAGYHA